MSRWLPKAIVALVMALTVSTVSGASALATPLIGPALGLDVSFPQCSLPLPPIPTFAVVGVNNGLPFSVNTCLAAELAWAQTSSSSPSFYLNTADPGPAHSSHWPAGQSTPQMCDGSNSAGCSYDYGWNEAQYSFAAVSALNVTASTATWWLDVETGSSWQTGESDYGTSATYAANDASSLLGAVAYLTSVGVTTTGIYSTSTQWRQIAGVTGSLFASLPIWVAGFSSPVGAAAGCSQTSFSGGAVTMTQYPSGSFDGDYWCNPASEPTDVSAVASPSGVVVSWNAPTLSTSPTYVVSTSPGGAKCTTTTTSCIVSGLTGGLTYTFSVLATPTSGVFAISAPSGALSVASAPGVPRCVITSPSKGTVVVLARSGSTGGSPISSWQYSITGGATLTRASHSLTIHHLRSGQLVRVRVRALNQVGAGPWSALLRIRVR